MVLAVTLTFRLFFTSPFLPETLSEKLFSIIPGEVESYFVLILGTYAKYLTVVGFALSVALLYGLYGIAFTEFYERFEVGGKISKGLTFSLLPWLLQVGLILALTGFNLRLPFINVLLYLLPAHLAYGATLGVFYSEVSVEVKREEAVDLGRRGHVRRIFIRRVAPAAVGIAILIYGIDRFLFPLLATPRPVEKTLQDLYLLEVTPTEEFYRTDIDIIPPSVNTAEWRLTVDGDVANPKVLTYDELKAMPAVKEYATLECISNPIGGPLIGTALWEGVRLSTILEGAGVKSTARYVVFYGEDGYSVAIPLDRAMREGAILAYSMNGAPLNSIHGHPSRAIVPGIFGMMNAKWINRIELVSEEYIGYWQTRGWSNTAEVETTSVIKIPEPNVKLTGLTTVAGIAFAGDRGISKVEVSTDDGETWREAMLKDPLSAYTWVLWASEWMPKADGRYTLKVRTTDKNGNVQTSQIRGTYPDGATGYHAVDVVVET